jgi:hypothetical protein
MTDSKSYLTIIVSTAMILLVPLIAMQFSSEVNWSIFDFAVASALLLGFGFTGLFVRRRLRKPSSRIMAYVILILLFAMIWLELAVGLFNSPFAGS